MKEESWRVLVKTKPEKVYEILTDMEEMKDWMTSHSQARYKFPLEEKLRPGSIVTMKSKYGLWTIVGKCIGLTENQEVRQEFIEGPLKGNEYWTVKPHRDGTLLEHRLVYEFPRLGDRIFWKLIGQRAHSKGKEIELEQIRVLAERDIAEKKE